MKIALGTVQFGVNYGISNAAGKTPQEEVVEILAAATRCGVTVLDTASLYGDSEAVLGRSLPANASFKIVTKTPQFSRPALGEADLQRLVSSFHESLAKLGKTSVYGLLMHRPDDLLLPGGKQLFNRLLELKGDGLVSKVGVSVYSGKQIDRLLDLFPIDLIQLPINVLDQRLLQSGHLRTLKKAGVEIHARSAFLQGLLLMDLKDIPKYFDRARVGLESYRRFVEKHGWSPLQASLGFVCAIPEIDQVVCGVNTVRQFEDICGASLTGIRPEDFGDFAVADEMIVNPALWKLEEVGR